MANWWDSAPLASPLDIGLHQEGITGPLADLARSVYQQESAGGRNTRTSNAGAVGGMQILPSTFAEVADDGWDINDPVQNARAGLRYLGRMYELGGNDPRMAAIGYYGGPGAIRAARAGQARRDPRNPQAPDTFQYADQVVARTPREPGLVERVVNAVIPAAQAEPVPQGNWWDQYEVVGAPTQQASPAQQDESPQQQTPDRGMLESIGAGLGYGTGQVGLGAQEWLGKGLQTIGADTAGDWLVQDAQAGRKRLAQEFEPYQQAHPIASTTGQIGGNVAATMWPVGLLGKTVGALGEVMPFAKRLGQAISSGGFRLGAPAGQTGMQLAANAATRAIGGGIAGGTSAGLVNPDDAGAGAMIGAATPAIIKPAALLGRALTTGAKSLAEPFYQSGRNQIIGRLLNEAAGPDAAAVRGRLSGVSPSPIGVQQTAAEVANNPGIATLQRTATQTDPVVSAELSSRAIRNDDARQAAIEGIIPDRAAAVTARQQATEPLYRAAYGKAVTITPEIESLMKRPSMRQALGKAAGLAQETGDAIDLDRGLTGQAAHYIKMALDDMVNSANATGLTGNQLRAIRDTRSAFLKEIEDQIPEYAQARAAYQDLSKPINQADVLREILDRGAPNKARGNITPAAFARALSDRTAQSVTKQKNATLEGVLSDDQRRVLADVLGSLRASDFANTAGKGVGSDTVQKLAYSNMLNRFGVLEGFRVNPFTSTAGNLLARVGSAAYGMANNQLRQELAQALLDPKTTANLMSQGVPNAQLQRLANALRNTEQIGYRALPLVGAPMLNQ